MINFIFGLVGYLIPFGVVAAFGTMIAILVAELFNSVNKDK